MNNEKLNIQHLITEISTKTGETKKDTELFLREFVSLIQEALFARKQVKINGLGTFKLQWSDSRRSVNVQTGEEIEIPGRYRVTFTPENEMKDFINEPYAHLETVLLDEEDTKDEEQENEKYLISGLSTQASEIASLISDIKTLPQEEKEEKITEIETEITTTNQQKEIMEETKTNPETQVQEQEQNSEKTEVTTNVEVNMEVKQEENPPKKKKGGWLWILLILLLIAGAIWFFFFKPQVVAEPEPELIETVEAEEEELVMIDFPDGLLLGEDAIADGNEVEVQHHFHEEPTNGAVPQEITHVVVATDVRREPVSTAGMDFYNYFNPSEFPHTVVRVTQGGRLAMFAREIYGSHIFWPYIYLANRDILTDPHGLRVGQQIWMPVLPREMIDLNNPEAVERAEHLERLILGR